MTSPGATRVEDRGDHLLVTLDNPGRRNTLSPDAYAVLGKALEQAAIKRLLAQAQDSSCDDHLDHERDAMARALGGAEAAAGIAARLARRAPRFDRGPAEESASDAP